MSGDADQGRGGYLGQLTGLARFAADWLRGERAMARFAVRAAVAPSPAGASAPVAVLIQPWLGTAVPWWQLAVALLLRRRGRDVLLLWDDLPLLPPTPTERLQRGSIARVLARTPLARRRLSSFAPASLPAHLAADLVRLGRLNAIKEHLGETWSSAQLDRARDYAGALGRVAPRVARVFAEVAPAYLVVPGGVYGSSGLYPALGAAAGVRVASFDSGEGILLLSVDGVAAQLADVAAAFHALGPLPPWARRLADEEWSARAAGRDRFASQAVPAGGGDGEPVGALLPLNQSHDTAALGMSRLFEGQDDWLMSTVAWLLAHGDQPVTVRQHPCERLYPGRDDYRARLQARFGTEPRLRFVDAAAPVNTYDLIRRARVVLPHVSTVGVEAVMLGAPVVVEARSAYAELGFVARGADREGYHAAIARALRGEAAPTVVQQEAARACYYLTQVCNFYPSDFSPMMNAFHRWSRMSAAELEARADVSDLLDALESATPLALLRHRRLAATAGHTSAA